MPFFVINAIFVIIVINAIFVTKIKNSKHSIYETRTETHPYSFIHIKRGNG